MVCPVLQPRLRAEAALLERAPCRHFAPAGARRPRRGEGDPDRPAPHTPEGGPSLGRRWGEERAVITAARGLGWPGRGAPTAPRYRALPHRLGPFGAAILRSGGGRRRWWGGSDSVRFSVLSRGPGWEGASGAHRKAKERWEVGMPSDPSEHLLHSWQWAAAVRLGHCPEGCDPHFGPMYRALRWGTIVWGKDWVLGGTWRAKGLQNWADHFVACRVWSKSSKLFLKADTWEVFAYKSWQMFILSVSQWSVLWLQTHVPHSAILNAFSLCQQTALRVWKRPFDSYPCFLEMCFAIFHPPSPPFLKPSLKAWENFCHFLAGDFERPVPADSQRAGGLMQNSIKECCARGFQCLRVTMTSAVIFIYIIKQLELMEPVKE